MRAFIISLILLAINAFTWAQAPQPPIEAYGELQTISDLAISPTGSHIAYINREDDVDALIVQDTETGESWGIGINELKVTQVRWAGPDYVIIGTFDTGRFAGVGDKANYSAAFSISLKTQKITRLLEGNTPTLHRNQTGIGYIVGRPDEDDFIYMPAYSKARNGTDGRGAYSLYRVNLDSGRGRIVQRGYVDVIDYIVEPDGTILAEESYSNSSNQYQVRTKHSGDWETIHDRESPEGPGGLLGTLPDGTGLIFGSRSSSGFNALYKMDYSGEFSDAIMSREGVEINRVVFGENKTVIGVEYGGLEPSYEFFDEELTADINRVLERIGTGAVRLRSWTDDWNKLILYVEGNNNAGDYILLDRATDGLSLLASSRPDIPTEAISEVITIEYEARDGLLIPALITVPRGAELNKLPLIVMPHGGPESHDQVGFDYMAQYFANRGYMVFQPNFRGSNGFGTEFTKAGYGGWGSSMQHDITDGVKSLIRGGQVDPERVCIVGWSYGGYAALAGGAFTPDLYQCVASIAGVSDLPQILVDERRDHGRNHWVVQYWEGAMANGDATRDVLREKSPAMFAENFQAPVLLMHGRDDLTVKVNQSRIMRKALKRADHPVELIEYRGGDHSLSTPGDRLEVLQELDRFITAHIGANW